MPAVSSSKYVVQAGWEHAPHLDDKTKAELLESTPLHLRKARSEGTPSLGIGAIYPILEEEIVCTPFRIPEYWARGYGLDVGWNRTAAVFLAYDRDNDIIYAYSEHYRGEAEPAIHASAIKARGVWLPGFIDPAARGRSQIDGQALFDKYTREEKLPLVKANNAVEAGILEVLQRMSTGRLKIFTTMQNLLWEYRQYHRNDKGLIVKTNDHALDALRYGVMSAAQFITRPIPRNTESARGRDALIGY